MPENTFLLGRHSMTSTLRTHAHVGALSVLTAAAVTAALAAVPALPPPRDRHLRGVLRAEPPLASRAPSAQLVTLVTGDRVVLRHDGQGHTTASLTPGSPHYGRPVEHVAAGTHTWVVPKLAAVGAQPARPVALRRLRPGDALRPSPADGHVRARHLGPRPARHRRARRRRRAGPPAAAPPSPRRTTPAGRCPPASPPRWPGSRGSPCAVPPTAPPSSVRRTSSTR